MPQPRTRRAGLIIAALLGLVDIVAAIAGGGDSPPVPIAILIAALGAGTLVAVRYGWKGTRIGIAATAATRTLSALAAVPGFFAGGPPLVVATVLVAATALTLALLAKASTTNTAQ
jgi:hypothetical protein